MDQSVYVTRTEDYGKTWSRPLPLENNFSKSNPAGWLELVHVADLNRVYAFYFYNETGVKRRDGTGIFIRYSEDRGSTWSRRFRVELPNQEISTAKGEYFGWFMDRPIVTKPGTLVAGFTLVDPKSLTDIPDKWRTEIFFLRIEDIATVVNFEEAKIEVFPKRKHGISVAHPITRQPFGQEPSILELNRGVIVSIFRTRVGAVHFTLSKDDGRTWSAPQALRFEGRGEVLEQPVAPASIRRIRGRIAILFHNNSGGLEWLFGRRVKGTWVEYWGPRYPIYLTMGHFNVSNLEVNAGLTFAPPVPILTAEGDPASPEFRFGEYPDLMELDGDVYLFYSLDKREIAYKRIPKCFFEKYEKVLRN
jgi:hypothetical protein